MYRQSVSKNGNKNNKINVTTNNGGFPKKKKRRKKRRKFICQICDEAFYFSLDLSIHKLGHIGHDHVDIQKLSSKKKKNGGHHRRRFKYRCAFCSEVCTDRVELERHFIEMHKKKRRRIRKREEVEVDLSLVEEVEHEQEKAQEQSRPTSTPSPTLELGDKQNEESLIPRDSEEHPELRQQVDDVDKTQFLCPTSPNQSKSKLSSNSNKTNSTQRKKCQPKKEKLFQCSECEKTFLRLDSFKAHQRTHKMEQA